MQRGEIWWAALGVPQGSEPGYRRPVLIVSVDDFNTSAIQTVLAVAITSNLRLAQAPGNLVVRPRETGLDKPSVINISQLATLDKARLLNRVGRLSAATMRQVEEGLRLILGL